MKAEAPLRQLYELTYQQFPALEHSPEEFVASIQMQLLRDPIRNRSLRRDLAEQKLELMLSSQWPLNDFLQGLEGYLCARELPADEAHAWSFRVRDEYLLFREERK